MQFGFLALIFTGFRSFNNPTNQNQNKINEECACDYYYENNKEFLRRILIKAHWLERLQFPYRNSDFII